MSFGEWVDDVTIITDEFDIALEARSLLEREAVQRFFNEAKEGGNVEL